jgi:branched-chain amino acid transport system ATP-binding protein
MLRVRNLHAGYESLEVLHGISFDVPAGGLSTILGSNGAGKSTTLLTLIGMVAAWEGAIEFEGRSLAGLSPRARARAGIVLVPEGRRVFGTLPVEENLRLGAWAVGISGGACSRKLEEVFDHFPRLRERRRQAAATLSGGEQQMLAIGRGLMANPRLLLIDECSLGLSPVMIMEVLGTVSRLVESGTTVIAVEQSTDVLTRAKQAIVLEQGTVVRTAAGSDLSTLSDALRLSYLGETNDA